MDDGPSCLVRHVCGMQVVLASSQTHAFTRALSLSLHSSPAITAENVDLPVKSLWLHVGAAVCKDFLRPFTFRAFNGENRDTSTCDDLFPSDIKVKATSSASLHKNGVFNVALQAISLRICITLLCGGAWFSQIALLFTSSYSQ